MSSLTGSFSKNPDALGKTMLNLNRFGSKKPKNVPITMWNLKKSAKNKVESD